jgi:hypothetical protein
MRHGKPKLADRVRRGAEAALATQGFVCPLDVLLGIGWLNPGAMRRWQRSGTEYLADAIQIESSRLAEAMELFRGWAIEKGLSPRITDYIARTPQRQTLRFTRGGSPAIEEQYRTHWIPAEVSEKERDRLVEKASRPPELVVILPLKDDWTCRRCGKTGDFLIMENPGPACLHCTGLDDLEYLPAGDALLTRRAKARSKQSAVVVRFSRTRGRYERRGLLVEAGALEAVRRELDAERSG